MATASTLPLGRTDRLSTALAFAERLREILSDKENIDPKISQELDKLLKLFPLPPHLVSPTNRISLDREGTMLWNVCTKLKQHSSNDEMSSAVCRVRAFAFLLLESAQSSSRREHEDIVRILKACLVAARTCLDSKDVELASKVLEQAATHEDALSKTEKTPLSSEHDVSLHLSAEYFTLRMALAWRQDRLVLADHFFTKLPELSSRVQPSIIEKMADLLYEIGKFALDRKQNDVAVKWLCRAYESIMKIEEGSLYQDTHELKMSILHTYVRILLEIESEAAGASELASQTFRILEEHYGTKLPVMLLKLEIIARDNAPNVQQYSLALERIISTVLLTDANISMITHYIYRLNSYNPDTACKTLLRFLFERLAPHGNTTWTEKAFIAFVWWSTTQDTTQMDAQELSRIVSDFYATCGKSLTAEATQGALVLLWKLVDSSFQNEAWNATIALGRLAQHALFQSGGDTNKTKIHRRLLLCALAKQDAELAQTLVTEVPQCSKQDPLTQLLLYRIAVRSGDSSLAQDALEALCQADAGASTYLFACAAEAQRCGDRRQAVSVLQRILEKLEYGRPEGVDLPTMLRCTIRLLVPDLQGDVSEGTDAIEKVCRLFETAGREISSTPNSFAEGNGQRLSWSEIDWFTRNSYNLAVTYCTTWQAGQVLRLLDVSAQCVEAYISNQNAVSTDLRLCNIDCLFLGAILLATQARNASEAKEQHGHYDRLRGYIHDFHRRCSDLDPPSQAGIQGLNDRQRLLVCLDFEANVHLHAYASLPNIIEQAQQFGDGSIYATFADILLSSSAPVPKIASTLQLIINAVRQLSSYSTERASRWIRCVFQITMNEDVDLAETIIDQATVIAKEVGAEQYPEDELHWLAATSFNRAVDFYLAKDDERSRRWAEKAVGVAGLMRDDMGMLAGVLKEKMEGLW